MNIGFVNDRRDLTGETGYRLIVRSTEGLRLQVNPGATNIMTTDASYILINTWYRLRMKRTLDGEFTLWIKGGAFGNVAVFRGCKPGRAISIEGQF